MRSYLNHVALGALAFVFGMAGMAGTAGCSGDAEVVTAPKTDAGTDADADKPDTGGDADADADVPECSYTLTFATPQDGAQLTEMDDADGDFCVNGFQYDVTLATNAPDGTTVTLSGNAGKIGDATVAAGIARFSNVQLPSMGSETLRAEIADTTCSSSVGLSVACEGAPECAITAPVITQTHPKLNGVPVAEGGDRVSAEGSPYQVAFEVKTTVEDGQPVILKVDGNASAVSANAVGGVATFAGVTLVPDGDHTVVARCVPKAGIEGQSTSVTYVVDTEAPSLVARKVRGTEESDLQDGDHWNPEHDVDANKDGLQLRICGGTDASDAVDLPATLGAGQQNFCVAVGSSSPSCVPATTGGAGDVGDGGCVDIDCPGGGPFNLTLTMRDDAGNPTVKTTQAVTCASTLPQVQFLDPVSDGPPWNDIDKRILAASMAGQVARVDKDATTPGAQYDVVVCTNAGGGTGRLLAGIEGGTETEVAAATVEADTQGLCAGAGMSHILRFPNVTLPQSTHTSTFQLASPTVLRAEVTDASNGEGASSIRVWVDTIAPPLSIVTPSGLCTKTYQSTTAVTEDVYVASPVVPVTLTVGTTEYVGTTLQFGSVRFLGVVFPLGSNSVQARGVEPSGNVGQLQGSCSVLVGNPPVVTWMTPIAGSKLAAASTTGAGIIPDGDATTAGWQGTLRACTNIDMAANPAATLEFESSGQGAIGAPIQLDASGCAEIANANLPDSNTLTLTARTSPIEGVVGTSAITVPVDSIIPAAPTGIQTNVLNRRQTSFHLAWTSPDDGGKAPHTYDVRVAQSPIGDETSFLAATTVKYTGQPATPGAVDGVNAGSLYIENDYYFAVRAVDVAGNRSPVISTSQASRAEFSRVTLSTTTPDERYGAVIDGSGDLNGDGLADIVVGSYNGNSARLHFGTSTGLNTVPDTVISGSAVRFGYSVTIPGDLNGDGLADLVIGSPFGAPGGLAYIFYGRVSWPATLSEADADVRIEADVSQDSRFQSLASRMARAGDFNGDGIADFLVSDPYFNSNQGMVAVVFGKSGGLPSVVSLPSALGTSATAVYGDSTKQGFFGLSAVGIPGLFSGPKSAIVVAAPFTNSNAGTVYTFHDLEGPAFDTSDALAILEGTGTLQLGYFGLGTLRGIPALTIPAVSFALPRFAPSGRLRAWSGPGTNTFQNVVLDVANPDSLAVRTFSRVHVSSAYSGTSLTGSFIGSAAPDIVVSQRAIAPNPARLLIIDGDRIPATPGSPSSVHDMAPVRVDLPQDWGDFAFDTTAIRDLDGDGYADVAIGEGLYTAGTLDGRVIILY